ncbi:MAG: alpha/beta hydrolase [Alphaproteobacteria bacterium]|nr:alpha/beta hydrolase [Alphaproteobacteria bacterium]
MARAHANGIEIEHEITGAAGAPAIMLVNGLGAQLVSWPASLIDGLMARGFRVLRFDNRDCGLSTKIEAAGPADIEAAFKAARAKLPVAAAYALEDMADDAAGLLQALAIPAAHVVGSSNGGAIAQIFAFRHASKTLSLVSIMATSGRRGLPRPSEAANAWLNAPRKPNLTREEFIAEALNTASVNGSPGFPETAAEIGARAGRLYDRAYYPMGHGRHLVASIASSDSRVAHLASIRAPTLVIHGREDPLVPLGCGEDVRNSIRGAGLLVIDGMAHDLPEPVVPRLVTAIAENAGRAKAVA